MSVQEFRIRHAALESVIAHARAALPAECCGMLLGKGHSIDEAVRANNTAVSATRFLIDPKDHIEARRDARGRGLDVVGFYHSHPHSSARPSQTDVAEASYPDAVHLIVSLEGGSANVGLFRIEPGRAIELPFASVA
jgi:proteasome lid subunit RPN8/RPN11